MAKKRIFSSFLLGWILDNIPKRNCYIYIRKVNFIRKENLKLVVSWAFLEGYNHNDYNKYFYFKKYYHLRIFVLLYKNLLFL